MSSRNLDSDKVLMELLSFDARRAQCFKPLDRERLIAVIEVGFGDLLAFNRRVAAVVRRSLMVNTPPPVRAASCGDIRV